jgi:uncharacterized protein YciI
MAEKAREGGKPGHRQFYVVWMSELSPAGEPPAPVEEVRKAHHDYLADLRAQGVLFASGPFRDSDGSRPGCGMMILKTRTFAEAHRIAAREPYRLHGLRTNKIMPWQLNEGALAEMV